MSVFTSWPEDVVWKRVSPRRFGQAVVARLVWLVILAAAGAAVWRWWPGSGLIGPAVAGGLIVLMLLRLVFVLRAIRAWGYAERADELLVRHGLLVRRLSIVPYGRMQFVDVTAGPFDRLFRLATVQLHTAAAASDARIPGLEPAEAARLRDALTRLGEAKAEGL